MPIGSAAFLGAIEPTLCDAYNPSACSGNYYSQGGSGYTYSWSATKPSIASITGSTTSASADFFGNALGSAGGLGTISTAYCQFSSSGQVAVDPSVSISGPSAVPLLAAGASGPNSITLTATGTPSGGSFSWSTTSGKVTLSNKSSATVTVTSAGASSSQGDTPVTVTYTYNSQQGSATQHITVQKPTLLVIEGPDSTTAEAECTTSGGQSGCGVTRTFTYQVLDQIGGGEPINFAGMPFWDVVCNTGTNQLNLQGYITTCGGMTGSCWGTGPCTGKTTNANGQFGEKLNVCAPACRSGNTCITAGNTIANQTWYVNGFAITKTLTYYCNKILVNGG